MTAIRDITKAQRARIEEPNWWQKRGDITMPPGTRRG